MSQSSLNYLTQKLIDWLIALCGASLLLWFVITQPVLINRSQDVGHNVDVQQLKNHVQLLTNSYAPRTINYNNLNYTADYIYSQFESIGFPEYQTINTISKEYNNVSLKLGPDTEEVYVVGAHFDAEDDSIDTEGNASGVATLIELARHLADNIHKLEIGVILIAYPVSLNQSDYIVNTGSFYHAKSLKKNNKKVRLMVSLDTVGQLKSPESTQKFPYEFMQYFYAQNKSDINVIGRLEDFNAIREFKKGFHRISSLSLKSHNLLESFNKTHSSDHLNYWKHGYPAVLISDVFDLEKMVKNELNIQPIVKLDYERLAKLVNVLSHVFMQTEAKDDDKTRLAQR